MMPFVTKQPCKTTRVLSFDACPPHNVPHKICEYPLYYDACYFPELHKEIFETGDSVKLWLVIGLIDHSRFCESCTREKFFVDGDVIDGRI